MGSIVAVWDAIVETLGEMGADSIKEGRPYGLRAYASYCRSLGLGIRKGACEEPLTAGVAAGLVRRGHPATPEQPYPMGGRSDLVVDLGDSELLWLECKTAYREHLASSKADPRYDYKYDGDNCYDPGRGRNSWVAGVSDIGGKDIPKLLTLRPNEAKFIGVLLLGFDRERVPLTNRELYDLLPSCLNEWTRLMAEQQGFPGPIAIRLGHKAGFGNVFGSGSPSANPRLLELRSLTFERATMGLVFGERTSA